MNRGQSFRRSCLGKAQYRNAGEARAAKRILPYGKTLDVYECVYCPGQVWHLGSSIRTTDGRAAKRVR